MPRPRTHPDNRSATAMWSRNDPDYQEFTLFCDLLSISKGRGLKLLVQEYLHGNVRERVQELLEKYGEQEEAC